MTGVQTCALPISQKDGVSGPVTGAKQRVIDMIFRHLKIKASDYVHGYERGVYYSTFYENSLDFFQNKITVDKLVEKEKHKNIKAKQIITYKSRILNFQK